MSQVAIREDKTSIQSVAFGRSEAGSGLAPQNLGDIVRFAEVMARADIAIPKHLRDNPGACLAVCMQAFNWQMDPFAVAQKSYKVGDQMAYEAQLIAAVINTRAGLKRRPQIEYKGAGGDRQCMVTFEAADGSVHLYESPRFSAITTKNSPLWKSDPDQQLGYYSIRAGARRHFPEVILGVYDRDELEGARDVTPAEPRPSLSSRLAAQAPIEPASKREGFDHSSAAPAAETRQQPATATVDTNEAAGTAPDRQEAPGDSRPASEPSEDDVGETEAIDPDAPAGQHEDAITPAPERLVSYTRDMMAIAGGDGDAGLKKDRLGKAHMRWRDDIAKLEPDEQERAKSVLLSAQMVAKGEADHADAVSFFAEVMSVEPAMLMGDGNAL
jgi:hypothetical protein